MQFLKRFHQGFLNQFPVSWFSKQKGPDCKGKAFIKSTTQLK